MRRNFLGILFIPEIEEII